MKVRYNGGRESLYWSSNPKNLTVGRIYDVVSIKDLGFQTNFLIEDDTGEYGEFNSVWFQEIAEKAFLAVSRKRPVEGERLHCTVVQTENENPSSKMEVRTSTVKNVRYLGNSIYDVRTKKSRYIVTVVR